MMILTFIRGLIFRLNPFQVPSVIDGNRIEINRRIHKIMYGIERD